MNLKQVATAILAGLSLCATAQVPFSCDISNGKDKQVIIYISRAFTTDTLAFFKLQKGKGSVNLNLKAPSFVMFKCDKEYTQLYLNPSGSLDLSTDYDAFDKQLEYSGDQELLNNFLADEMLARYSNIPDYHMPTDSFAAINEDWLGRLNQQLEDFIYKNKGNPLVSESFHQLAKARLRYEWAMRKYNYPDYHQAYTGEVFEADDNYNEYIASLNLNNRDLLPVYYYREFLRKHLADEAIKELPDEFTPAELLQAQVKVMRNTVSDGQVRNFLFTSLIYWYIEFNGITGVDPLLPAYYETCTDSQYSDFIEKLVKKWEHLRPGLPAPVFTYPDINGKTISSADFKGSYLYIDVWATWCGPCKGEIPYLDTLETTMAGKNIKFMSVSVDEKKNAWEKMVREKALKGTQLFTNGWKTEITKQYNIKGIPRFILIDPEGKIVDACAPRPSGAAKKLISEQPGINLE